MGLQAPYTGPFPVVSRPSRSTVKIRVGYFQNGEPKYEVRNWRDIKIGHLAPDAPVASRPKRGRPSSKKATALLTGSEADNQDGVEVNNAVAQPVERAPIPIKNNQPNSNVGGKPDAKPVRSTRNPSPNYVDSVTIPQAWSASPAELDVINRMISRTHA